MASINLTTLSGKRIRLYPEEIDCCIPIDDPMRGASLIWVYGNTPSGLLPHHVREPYYDIVRAIIVLNGGIYQERT